jgi:hypothetical protein
VTFPALPSNDRLDAYRARTSWRVWAGAVTLIACLIALASLCGPLFPFKPAPSNVADAVAAATDLDRYLREHEAQHVGRSALAKTIVERHARRAAPQDAACACLSAWILRQPKGHFGGETLAARLGANAF